MSVGVLIISHDGIGEAVLGSATAALGYCPLATRLLSASRDCDPEKLHTAALRLLKELDEGSGVLILTDLYGSTPSNVASRLLDVKPVRIVAGLNLPMLIRVFNYPELTLEPLTEKAISGGLNGIFGVESGKA
jgi:mannose PTS system EIIA component